MDVSDLPIAKLVKKRILQSLTPEDRQRARLGPALRRQHCGKIVVENAQNLDTTEMQKKLPRGSRVIVTDVGSAALASRVEVCFLLQDRRKCAFRIDIMDRLVGVGGFFRAQRNPRNGVIEISTLQRGVRLHVHALHRDGVSQQTTRRETNEREPHHALHEKLSLRTRRERRPCHQILRQKTRPSARPRAHVRTLVYVFVRRRDDEPRGKRSGCHETEKSRRAVVLLSAVHAHVHERREREIHESKLHGKALSQPRLRQHEPQHRGDVGERNKSLNRLRIPEKVRNGCIFQENCANDDVDDAPALHLSTLNLTLLRHGVKETGVQEGECE